MRALGLLRRFAWALCGIGLLFAVYLLPPDTSLAELHQTGILPVCVPVDRPPLITTDPARPGVDAELLSAIAGELGLRLSLQKVPEMGRDFDPRSWRLTRARCAIIAGGIVGSPATRSFLEVSPAYAETGWVALSPTALPDLTGQTVGVLAQAQGLDRVALSTALRREGVRAIVVRSPADLAAGIESGRFEAGITEALLGRSLASARGWSAEMLPLERYPLVLGLWKGDLTLKRAVETAFATLQRDGRLEAILDRYGVGTSSAVPRIGGGQVPDRDAGEGVDRA